MGVAGAPKNSWPAIWVAGYEEARLALHTSRLGSRGCGDLQLAAREERPDSTEHSGG